MRRRDAACTAIAWYAAIADGFFMIRAVYEVAADTPFFGIVLQMIVAAVSISHGRGRQATADLLATHFYLGTASQSASRLI